MVGNSEEDVRRSVVKVRNVAHKGNWIVGQDVRLTRQPCCAFFTRRCTGFGMLLDGRSYRRSLELLTPYLREASQINSGEAYRC
jgi:hypothetical protein